MQLDGLGLLKGIREGMPPGDANEKDPGLLYVEGYLNSKRISFLVVIAAMLVRELNSWRLHDHFDPFFLDCVG